MALIVMYVTIVIILNVFISIQICRGLSILFMLWKQYSENDKFHIYTFNLKKEMWNVLSNWWFVSLALLWSYLSFICPYANTIDNILFMILIFSAIAVHHFSFYSDENHILEINNLHIGYGAALAYYKNYLEMISDGFSERIDQFRSYNGVEIPKKLFILVPYSCKVHKYLENDEHIERCHELKSQEISYGGIKNRIFNTTVYYIDGLRMAIEYAQPLKTFYLFKKEGRLTKIEMEYQRKLFVKTLKDFLNADQYKYFEVIEFDDSSEKDMIEILKKNYYLHVETV